jgi:hypothetical protein
MFYFNAVGQTWNGSGIIPVATRYITTSPISSPTKNHENGCKLTNAFLFMNITSLTNLFPQRKKYLNVWLRVMLGFV